MTEEKKVFGWDLQEGDLIALGEIKSIKEVRNTPYLEILYYGISGHTPSNKKDLYKIKINKNDLYTVQKSR